MKKEMQAYMKLHKIEKMTEEQMDDFIAKIQDGKDHTGKDHPQLKAFNDDIKKQRQAQIDFEKKQGRTGGLQKPQTRKQRLQQGKSFKKRADYFKVKTGAILAGLLGACVSEAKGAIEVAADSKHFRDAIGALSEGDLARADRQLLGPSSAYQSDCFFADLVDKGYPGAAVTFEDQWAKAKERARERAIEGAKPHDK